MMAVMTTVLLTLSLLLNAVLGFIVGKPYYEAWRARYRFKPIKHKPFRGPTVPFSTRPEALINYYRSIKDPNAASIIAVFAKYAVKMFGRTLPEDTFFILDTETIVPREEFHRQYEIDDAYATKVLQARSPAIHNRALLAPNGAENLSQEELEKLDREFGMGGR